MDYIISVKSYLRHVVCSKTGKLNKNYAIIYKTWLYSNDFWNSRSNFGKTPDTIHTRYWINIPSLHKTYEHWALEQIYISLYRIFKQSKAKGVQSFVNLNLFC